MWARERGKPKHSLPVLVFVSVACLMMFIVAEAPVAAAAVVPVNVGGEYHGSPLAVGGVIWFNGYDKDPIVIRPGDTVQWKLVGGIHTVTSTDMRNATVFAYDSSPLFPVEAALADMAPGRLLPPGSIYDVDTALLPLGTYTVFCKIHPGMMGNLTVVAGVPDDRFYEVITGWGDPVYAVQAFAPQDVTVAQGTIVRYILTNPTEPHTVTGTDTGGIVWDSSPDLPPGAPPVMLVPGTTFNWTFTTEGTFTYFCKLHAYKIGDSWVGMVGTVIVAASAADTAGAAAAPSYAALGVAIAALILSVASLMRRRGSGGPPPST